MIKVKVTQNKFHSYEDEGKVVTYDMNESVEFGFESIEDAYDFIATCVLHGVTCGKTNTTVEITKED